MTSPRFRTPPSTTCTAQSAPTSPASAYRRTSEPGCSTTSRAPAASPTPATTSASSGPRSVRRWNNGRPSCGGLLGRPGGGSWPGHLPPGVVSPDEHAVTSALQRKLPLTLPCAQRTDRRNGMAARLLAAEPRLGERRVWPSRPIVLERRARRIPTGIPSTTRARKVDAYKQLQPVLRTPIRSADGSRSAATRSAQ